MCSASQSRERVLRDRRLFPLLCKGSRPLPPQQRADVRTTSLSSGVTRATIWRGTSGAEGNGVRKSRYAGERSSPGRAVGPRAMRSIARDDRPVGLGRCPQCPRPERPRNTARRGRTATRHRRGTDAHRSVAAPLSARRRAATAASQRSAAPKHGLPPSPVAPNPARPKLKPEKKPLTCENRRETLAVAEGFEPSDGFAVTRFRGVLLRPLGHATAEQLTHQPRLTPIAGERRRSPAVRHTPPRAHHRVPRADG